MAYQPKSYKKFVATAATATLVATAVVPAAFADEVKTAAFTDVAPQYAAAVEFVVAQNIAKGLTETTFGISADIKRGDAAIMIANAAGLNDEKAPQSGFSDVPTRGVLAINSLKAAGVVNGKSTTNFGFNDSITRGEAAIMFANAFKLTGDANDVKFTDVSDRYLNAVAALVEEGVTNGISATQFGTTNNIKRGDFARFVYALEEYIVGEEEVVAPEVAAVTAVDAETIVINFTGALDKKSVTEGEHFSVSGNTVEEATLSSDGKAVTLTLGSLLTNKEEVTVTVDNELQTLAGENFAEVDFVKNVLFNDEVAPTVSAISTPNGGLRVTFSEQISVPAAASDDVAGEEIAIVVNGQSLTLDSSDSAWISGNVISVPKSAVDSAFDLKAGTNYSVAIAGAQDLVGNEMTLYTGTLSYQVVTDKTAPTVASVTAAGENTVNVKFSEEISDAILPTFTVKRNGSTIAADLIGVSTEDGVTYELDFSEVSSDVLFPESETTAPLEITISGARDLGNNVSTAVTKSVTLTEDNAKPTLTSTVYNSKEEVAVLTFNEEIVDTDINADDAVVIINNATSQVVNATTTVVEEDGTIEIAGLASGSYSVRVPAGVVADTSRAANTNAAFTTTVTVSTEVTDVTVTGATSPADDQLRVTFSNEVIGGTGSNSAANVANYRLDGKALPAGTLITLNANSTVATITLPTGSIETTRTAILTVSNVKADNGTTVPTSSALVYVEDSKAPVLSSAVVDGTELVLTFSENITAVEFDATDFITKVNGVEVVENVEAGENDNQLIITTSDASFATGTITVEVAETTDITDAAGNPIVEGTVVTATR